MSTPATATTPAVTSCVIAPHLKDDVTQGTTKYGQMFPNLPCNACDEAALLTLGGSGSIIDAAHMTDDDSRQGENPCVPAGWPIFGQFIAHDITADRSLLQHHATLGTLRNFRSPALNLESIYGAGPSGSPYMFDNDDADLLLLGRNDAGRPDDLPRNQQGRALIGDPRNDVHLPISQLHVAFLKFHNAIVARLRAQGTAPGDVFREAQRLVRWHYQWITVHEFLPLAAGQAVVDDILTNGRRFYQFDDQPFIPIEFSDAAYRFGHSQIRAVYQLNDSASGAIFPDLAGFRPVPAARVIDWRRFFAVDPQQPPQPSRRIDARVAHPLITLPDAVVGTPEYPEERSLAYRDLQRGRALDMPSGEAVARALGVAPLTPEQVGLAERGWTWETPLWYYLLKEAEVQTNGVSLGEAGGRIVAEVLIGLLDGDPTSYRANDPAWQPELPGSAPGTFTMADLLHFAEVA